MLTVTVCTSLLLASRRWNMADAESEALNDVRLTKQVAGMFDKTAIALGAVGFQVDRQTDTSVPDLSMLWSIEDGHRAVP